MKYKDFYDKLTTWKSNATHLAILVSEHDKKYISEIFFDENEIEVEFNYPSKCGCCPDDTYYVRLKPEEIESDNYNEVVKVRKEEQERQKTIKKQKQLDKEKIERLKAQKDQEKYEREEYKRLKKKFENKG